MRSTGANYGGVEERLERFQAKWGPVRVKKTRRKKIESRSDSIGTEKALAEQMSHAQALRLKRLSEETSQPTQYARGLTAEEAERRIQALEAEIALADSF